jgi:O-antigen ligase
VEPTEQNSLTPPGSRSKRVLSRPKAGFFAGLLFLLLFSGPPKFRIRDAAASLYGEVDLSIIVNVVVWGLGGAWVFYQLCRAYSQKRLRLRLWLPQKIAVLAILLLGASTAVSLAPEVTAFKVYQILVAFLFTLIFAEWYGVETCLNRLLFGSSLLCAVVALLAFIAPDLVLATSETGFPRLRGQGITEVGFAATFALVLLLTTRRRLSKPVFISLGAFLAVVLFLSLARVGWVALGVFFALALVKRPKITTLPWVYFFWISAAIGLAAGLVTKVSDMRDPETVFTLSGRLGLWAFLASATLTRSPWLGFGYLAGTRDLGMQYDPELGSGHSIFFDVFVGGGILSLAVFLVLVVILAVKAVKLLREKTDAISFAVGSVFLVVLLFALIGEDIDSSPFGFTFWALVTMLPLLGSRAALPLPSPVPGNTVSSHPRQVPATGHSSPA